MSHIFESVMEKTARILARQYGVNVVFEGNVPYTDGKTIYLPNYSDLSEELKKDMQGFLDHEVAHCKFTEMQQIKHCINKLHNLLTQNIEDYRIEKEMIKDFPGCQFNLGPLNEKYRGLLNVDWEKRPWPIRLITTIRDIVEGRPARIDDDFKRYIDIIKDEIEGLRGVKTTKEVRERTEEIIKKIKEEREKEKEEEGDGEDDKKGDKKKEKGKGKPSAGEGEGDEEGESGDIDDMLDAKEGSKTAKEMDKFVTSVEGMMEEAFSKKAKEEEKVPSRHEYRIDPKGKKGSKIVPATTRFDKVTDHSGKGNAKEYAALKKKSASLIAPIKYHLERILKVKENAKWSTEKERGSINSRSLAQLASNKSYRQIFKQFTKMETNNVAVELLIDLSGSMSGRRIEMARASAIGIAEALKDLGIPFEVTGFCSEHDHRVHEHSAKLGASRFGRRGERLDLHVFKSFDCTSLHGISEMRNGSQNPDGECIAWAAKRLSLQRQKRKILMVFSDGQPATGDTPFGLLQEDLRTRINEVSKFGIEIIGVGIETDYVKEFYPDYVILKDVKDLPKQAMGKIARLLEK
jgi:cobalamin biosynthesis protein CobT